VEPSGDALGAALLKALKARAPAGSTFFGCGGPLMAIEGFESKFHIDPFSVIGPVGALRAFPVAFFRAGDLAHLAAREKADAAILIDGWSFSRLTAEQLRKRAPDTKLYKYVAPQVWASRPHRADTVKTLFDGVLTLFDFEMPWFECSGLSVACVGNPIFQAAYKQRCNGLAFRERRQLGDAPLLAVLLGSRRGEIRRHAAPFGNVVKRLVGDHPRLRIVAPLARAVAEEARTLMTGWPGEPVFVEAADRFAAFAAADAALAASGTVTTELAISKTPMAVAYKVHPLTAMWVRRVVTTPYVSLINVAAGRAVVPEFLQENCEPAAIANVLSNLLADENARRAQLDAFPKLLEGLGVSGSPAGERAAETVLDWLGA